MSSDTNQDELRADLAALVEETRRHVQWMIDGGIRFVRREAAPGASMQPRAPAASGGRSRPAFLDSGQRPSAPTAVAPPAPAARVVPPPAPAPVAPAVRPAMAPAPAPVAPAQRAPVTPSPMAPAARPPPPVTPAAVTRPAPAVASADAATQLRAIREDLGDCRRCQLCSTRTKIVFGQGNPHAEIVFVGEGPGEDEDRSGEAFVGRAGELLTKMIEAMGYSREQVYICNIVKCRPPGNRRPEPVEIDACRPFVERQLRAIRPKVIVALGATATQALLRTDTSISRLRNSWHAWEGIPVMPTFHPSYLLRAPQEKGKTWDDLKLVLARLGRDVPRKP